jgi:hypothetical protein
MTADADLPVWTIKPNWANGITERLSWLTDVLASTYGTEQRRALRLSPRREFEMTFNPFDNVRSYFDLWLHRMGSFEFMVPLFHDSGKLTAAVASGATAIPFDTTYREFEIGQLAIIIGDDPWTYDKVTITGLTSSGITVNAGEVTRDWGKRSRIHPLRRARISDESLLAALTNRVGEATLQFQLNQANDIANEGAWDTMYLGYPVIEAAPNRRENLDLNFNRNSQVLDNDLGLRVLNDDAGRAFTVQVDNRMMAGRADHWTFRQMLYRLRGQQGTLWLPTFNRDIELSQAVLSADAFVNIKKIGYSYTGGAIDGRQHVLFPGGLIAKVTGTGAEPSAAEEHLILSAAFGADLPAGTFASFMDTCRLASDDIEIQHHTDTDGAAECNLGFRSFRDPRTELDPLTISYPIPTAGIVPETCGSPAPEEASCVDLPSGYWARIIVRTDLGPNFPVIGPWSWLMTFSLGGINQATMINSDGAYSNYNGGGGFVVDHYDYLLGWTTYFYTPEVVMPVESGFATDPFADGDPDHLHINIQWPYNNYIFPGGSTFGDGQGTMSIMFQRVGGSLIDFGTIPIFGLWPASYEIDAL